MKVFRMISRSFRDAFKSLVRNFTLSIASISSITITLIIVCITIIASYNVNNFTNIMKKDVSIIVFLNQEIKEDKIKEIDDKLSLIDNIKSYKFISKKETLEEMKNTSDILESIANNWEDTENPLQDSYEVKVVNIEKISQTANTIKKYNGVSVVKYGEGMVDKLVYVFKIIQKSTLGIVLALILVTAFLISNTIKLTIHSRKKEIEIMRLVGASNWTIKMPFIIEGLFIGIIGSVIPILLATYGYIIFFDYFDGQLFSPIVKLVETTPFIYILSLILFSISILVSMWGSARAARKYLKI